ncbi:2OG-Fe(II) oxygenase [Limibacillus sp. MBR-115]|uniref:2OG-Fe(II) oxygenase n=1 Tax=Limibacillus sp. MBR-115 TaxID=3156465 RepID=UPI003390D5C8
MVGVTLRKASVRAPSTPPSYVACFTGVFTEAECLRLRDLVDLDRPEPAATKAGYAPLVRRSTIAWVPESPAWEWTDKRMATLLADANREQFAFELLGFEERLQVARYEAIRRGAFDWHCDRALSGLAASRKLSITVQLSEKTEYRGGNLEFFGNGRKWRAPRERGTAIVFASFLSHRVTPVTHGLRHSLVGWAHGPDFR